MKPGTFSTYAMSTLRLDPAMTRYIALDALGETLREVEARSASQAEEIIQRVRHHAMQGPSVRSDLESAVLAIASSALHDEHNPADQRFRAMRERAGEHLRAVESAIPGWASGVLHTLRQAKGIAESIAVVRLHQHLTDREVELAAALQSQEQLVAASVAELYDRCGKIEYSYASNQSAKAGKGFWSRAMGKFLLVALAFVCLAMLVMIGFGVPFLPYPALVILIGLLVAAVNRHRPEHLDDRALKKPISPYEKLRPQFQACARLFAEQEGLRRSLAITSNLSSLLNFQQSSELIDRFQAVMRALDKCADEIPQGTFIGQAPDVALVSGRALARTLWVRERALWSFNAFEQNLASISGHPTLADVVSIRTPADTVSLMLQAATTCIQEPDLTGAITALLSETLEGQEQFIGELDVQFRLLTGMIQIEAHHAAMPKDACPTLIHVSMPTGLKHLLGSILTRAFPRLALTFIGGEPNGIVALAETFNWLNSERKNHELNAFALEQRRELATTEAWSSFAVLLADKVPESAGEGGHEPRRLSFAVASGNGDEQAGNAIAARLG